MRDATLCLTLLFLSACVPRPDSRHSVVVRSGSDGSYHLSAAPIPPIKRVPEREAREQIALLRKRATAQELESYVLSQIAWFPSKAKGRFVVGKEHIVKSSDSYYVLVDIVFLQGQCIQFLGVLVSTAGSPAAIDTSGEQTCTL